MINSIDSVSRIDSGISETNFKASPVLNANFVLIEKELPKNKKVDWLNLDKILKPVQNTSSFEKFRAYKYSPEKLEAIRDGKIEKEKNHIASPVGERTAYNTKQLKACGVKNKDIIKYLTYDGHVTDAGKKILKEHGKLYR